MTPPDNNRPATSPDLSKDRAALLDWARTVPLVYGRDAWRAFKALYKHAEGANDPELLGALIARTDALPFEPPLPQALQNAYNPIAAMAAAQDRLLLHFQQTGRLEARPLVQPASPGEPERRQGRSASGIAWLGDSRYAVFAGSDRRGRSGILNVLDFAAPGAGREIASTVVGVPICVTATEAHAFALVAADPTYQHERNAPSGWAQFVQRTAAFVQGRQPGNAVYQQNSTTLHVFDLTNPSEPSHVTALAVPDATAMSLHGSTLVVATRTSHRWGQAGTSSNDGLTIIDISQPRDPRIVGFAPVKDIQAVAATDRNVFVLTRTQGWPPQVGLTVVDLTDPAKPRPRGSCELAVTNVSQSLAALRDQVYILGEYPLRLLCIDCSDPATPVLSHTLANKQDPYSGGVLEMQGTQVYVGTTTGVIAFDVTDPKHPFRLGDPPSVKTVGYMKRRARRALRSLASADPNAYVETAFSLLTAPDANGESLDLATQWAAYDVLFGNGSRFDQAHHGRGALFVRNPRLPRTPEYRAPDAWRMRPDLATRLHAAPDRPWQIYDAALKMLRAARVPLPLVPQGNLARFLRSPSPLLIRQATLDVAIRVAFGKTLPPELLADAWFLGNASTRRILIASIMALVPDATPAQDFAARLFLRTIGMKLPGVFSRRQETALMLLATRFPHALSGQSALPALGWLLTSQREEIIAWTLGAFARSATDLTPDWIAALEPVEPGMRQRALDALLAAMRGRSLDGIRARALAYADSAWRRESGWRAIAASTIPGLILRNVWDELFSAPDDSEALASALASSDALSTLERTGYTPDEILSRLQARPTLVGLLAPDAFATFALSLPFGALLPLLETVGEDSWQALRPSLLAALQDPVRSLAFWKAAWTVLPAQSDGALQERVLNDGPISETFLLTRDPEFLTTKATIFGPLLARWTRANASLFLRGSADLLAAATHALPDVRAWGLEHALSLGLDLPFALRLLESELPASVAAGHAFFEAAARDRPLEHALVLCDSPVASVRVYGQETLAKHWATVDQTLALERLCENLHPETQAFLARLLLETASVPMGASAFDRSVLRARGRARPAKELVKKRQTRDASTLAPPEDVAMLLEVARSRTPRDAEWALTRLAALALSGEEIPGVTLDGTAGI